MKFIFISCLLFFSFTISAQELSDLLFELTELYQKGEYEKAIPVAEKTAIAIKQTVGENNMFYTGVITIQANCYENTFQYEKAESIFLRLVNLLTATFGKNDISYTACIHNLATLYERMGQYEKAIPLFMEAMNIRKSIAGEYDSSYSSSLNTLAILYQDMGQYTKAEPLSIRSTEIRKKIYGENNPNYATSLNNLATLYMEMGQYEKAEPLFIRSKDINKIAFGEISPDYATSLNNLAMAWQDLEQYAKAEPALIQSMEIRKKTLGINHPDYAASLNNLAGLYILTGQYNKAEPLMIEAKEIWRKIFGENHPTYALGLNNVAAFYRKSQQQYSKAEALYLEAIRLRKKLLGDAHPLCSDSENDLGLLYTDMKEYKKAEPLFLTSSNIVLQNIVNTFSILSEKEKGKLLDYNRSIIESNNSFLYNCPNPSVAAIENNYNLELGFKSLALADTRNMLESLRNSKDSSIKRKFNQWVADKNLLSKQYELPATARISDLKKREDEAEVLEKELNRLSADFRNQQSALRITMRDVQKKLEAGEVAIEFIKFKLYNKKWTDSVMYAAFIIRKDETAPRFVKLCEKTQLQLLFDSAGTTALRLVKSFYRGLDIKDGKSKEARLGIQLYKLIWEPLEPFLKGIKKVSYSPAGKLYSIAFHALPVDSNTVLMDKYQLQQYTSTRQIALRTAISQKAKPGSIILFGNALFTMDSLQLVQKRNHTFNNQLTPSSPVVAKNRGTGSGAWIDLPGTAEEIKKIGQLFEQNKIRTQSFILSDASEENFKKITGQAPPILHIATHGFFLPEPGKKKQSSTTTFSTNAYAFAKDPLLRSGLVFAGGNYAWSGKTPVEGMEDGIATAYEISQMNLGNTELVVLSACETALGDIKGSEGVFGLQRGFKMAGVKNMIVSLWQVPDKETAELMTALYTYWLAGKTISESFNQAQADMRKKYAPYYWAAFVLVE